MITKFSRKRNVNTSLPFAKSSARIEVHSNGLHTFKFKKTAVIAPNAGSILNTESSDKLTNELSQYLTAD